MALELRRRVRRGGVFLAGEIRSGLRRIEGSFVPLLQASLASGLAYFLASEVFGRVNPMFAPIACFVCLGFKVDRVPRKVAELGVGATAGVLVGEAFALTLDAGWWQISLALICGAMTGRFLDRGDLTTIQGGVNAVVVLAMSWWQATLGGVTGRWMDALVGAGVAFVVTVLLPRHPTERPRRYARNTLSEFATLIDMLGRGLSVGDLELLADAREQRRVVGTLTGTWEEALTTARGVIRVNPSLWGLRTEMRELDRIFRLTTRAQRSSYMLGRQGLAMTEELGRMPEVGALVVELGQATRVLSGAVGGWNRPLRARAILLEVAEKAEPAAVAEDDWRHVALMSVVRALTVDLLQLTGMSRDDARRGLPDVDIADDHDDDLPPSESDDAPSALWG